MAQYPSIHLELGGIDISPGNKQRLAISPVVSVGMRRGFHAVGERGPQPLGRPSEFDPMRACEHQKKADVNYVSPEESNGLIFSVILLCASNVPTQ
jgi:hypothetical protein